LTELQQEQQEQQPRVVSKSSSHVILTEIGKKQIVCDIKDTDKKVYKAAKTAETPFVGGDTMSLRGLQEHLSVELSQEPKVTFYTWRRLQEQKRTRLQHAKCREPFFISNTFGGQHYLLSTSKWASKSAF
jgi:hypothetical protein